MILKYSGFKMLSRRSLFNFAELVPFKTADGSTQQAHLADSYSDIQKASSDTH